MAKKKGTKKKKPIISIIDFSPDHLLIQADSFLISFMEDEFRIVVAQKKIVEILLKEGMPDTLKMGMAPVIEIVTSTKQAKELKTSLDKAFKDLEKQQKKKKKKSE